MMNNTGLNMLLKSFGFDMAEVMAQVEAARQASLQMVQHFDQRLRRIEEKQDRILANQERIMGGGSPGDPVATMEVEAWKRTA